MAAITVKSWQRAEFKDQFGRGTEKGKRLADVPETISATLGEVFRADAIVADDYTRVVLWQDGDSGVAAFKWLWFESDADVLLELTMDRAGAGTGPTYAVVKVAADFPFQLAADELLCTITTSGAATTTEALDQIAVQNNVANAAGDANVSLVLLD